MKVRRFSSVGVPLTCKLEQLHYIMCYSYVYILLYYFANFLLLCMYVYWIDAKRPTIQYSDNEKIYEARFSKLLGMLIVICVSVLRFRDMELM